MHVSPIFRIIDHDLVDLLKTHLPVDGHGEPHPSFVSFSNSVAVVSLLFDVLDVIEQYEQIALYYLIEQPKVREVTGLVCTDDQHLLRSI